MKTNLQKNADGVFYLTRNKVALNCPFISRVVVPNTTPLGQQTLQMNSHPCSSLCPFFGFRDEPTNGTNKETIVLGCTGSGHNIKID